MKKGASVEGGVQPHSQGDIYPFVIVQQGVDAAARLYIIGAGYESSKYPKSALGLVEALAYGFKLKYDRGDCSWLRDEAGPCA